MTFKNLAQYHFTRIAVVTDNKTMAADITTFFEEYVFFQNNMNISGANAWSVEIFETREKLFSTVKKGSKNPYSCGLTFNTWDPANNIYDIEFHLSKADVPDTNLVAFDNLTRAPDFMTWNLWFNKASPNLYTYITEFIMRTQSHTPMDAIYPPAILTVGYAPMQSKPFEDISA